MKLQSEPTRVGLIEYCFAHSQQLRSMNEWEMAGKTGLSRGEQGGRSGELGVGDRECQGFSAGEKSKGHI
jgi:hypothetical protein